MSNVTLPSSGTNSTTSVQEQEQTQNFHHHDKRHKHKGHRSWGKGGGRQRQSTVPGYVWSDYFPVNVRVYQAGKKGRLNAKERHSDVQAKALLDNLRWVKGTLAAMGVGPKVLQRFSTMAHVTREKADYIFLSGKKINGEWPIMFYADGGAENLVTSNTNAVGDAVARGLMLYVNSDLNSEATFQESKSLISPSSADIGDASVIVSGYADVVGDVAAQRKKGSCSLKSEWKINESNVVAKAFRIFATELDRKATCGDKFSWQQAGRIWTEAMRDTWGDASVFDFKCDTIMAAKKLYPFNKEIKFVLVEAWKKAEAEMQTQLIVNGKNVTELRFEENGGFVGLPQTSTVPVHKLSAEALSWLKEYFDGPSIQVVPEEGTTPVTTVSYVFTDGSKLSKYYDPQSLPESLQDLIADPAYRQIGTQE